MPFAPISCPGLTRKFSYYASIHRVTSRHEKVRGDCPGLRSGRWSALALRTGPAYAACFFFFFDFLYMPPPGFSLRWASCMDGVDESNSECFFFFFDFLYMPPPGFSLRWANCMDSVDESNCECFFFFFFDFLYMPPPGFSLRAICMDFVVVDVFNSEVSPRVVELVA